MSTQHKRLRLVKNVFIPMSDGVRLAADLLMPEGEGKFPCILNYIPYHKDDNVSLSTSRWDISQYFAERGYCFAIVDIRGTGSSEGINTEIYSVQEQKDGYEVVEWLAAQPWCDGNVGMWGSSYGFWSTTLVAARNPPHLKAIVPFYGEADLYDTMWEGGSFIFFTYGGFFTPRMTVVNTMPPGVRDPEGKWIETWKERIEKNTPWVIGLLENQTDGEFWHNKSVAYTCDKIKAATLTLQGWNDPFPSAPAKFYSMISCPKKLILGPWIHNEPNKSSLGPRLDYYPILLRWFDHWLKGEENGIMEEPPVLLYTAEYTPPDKLRDQKDAWMNGSWRNEREWPIKRSRMLSRYLHQGRALATRPPDEPGRDEYVYNPTVGTASGLTQHGNFGTIGLPVDQRPDQVGSAVYFTEPLESDMEVTGSPVATIFVSSTATVAAFSVKLCDVAEDGTMVLLSDYYVNATRRESRSKPSALRPGEVYRLEIEMDTLSYRFPKGHKIAFMVASADFPKSWPTPMPATNAVHFGGTHQSKLDLPVVDRDPLNQSHEIPSPRPVPSRNVKTIVPDQWLLKHDYANQTVSVEWKQKSEHFPEEKSKFTYDYWVMATAHVRNPADTRIESTHAIGIEEPGSKIESKAKTIIQSDADFFHISIVLDIVRDGAPFASRTWSKTFPRALC